MFRKSMHWLGLGPDDDYFDDDEIYLDGQETDPASHADEFDEVRVLRTEDVRVAPSAPSRQTRKVTGAAERNQRTTTSVVPTAAANPKVVVPSSFDQAQEVADTFKNSRPVILNLQGAERDLSRRLIDFSSGLCYGLGGQMEKVANYVYLLTPADVIVSPDDRRRLTAPEAVARR